MHKVLAFRTLLAVATAFAGYSNLALATDLPLVKVKSTFPAGYKGEIKATIDDGGRGLTLFAFTDSRGSTMTFTVEDVRKGKVLVHDAGKDLLKVSGPNFTAEAGGEMIMTFLKGFFGNDRRELRYEYIRNGGKLDWRLQTNDPQGRDPFDGIAISINKKLGIPTSVNTIRFFLGDKEVRKYNPNDLPPATIPF
jgi:hypothetical protein